MRESSLFLFKAELLIGIPVALGLAVASWYNYILFHMLAELFTIVVAFSVFTIMWHSRRFLQNGYLLFLGAACLFIAILHLLHTLAYEGMPIFTEYGPNLATQLWIAARYVAAGSFLIAPFMLGRRLNLTVVLLVYTALSALIMVTAFTGVFPDCFRPETGLTPFKKISEYVISLIFVGAAGLLYEKRATFTPVVLYLLIASMAAGVLAELSFTFYIRTYGLSNLIGHIFMALSVFFIYKALVETGLRQPYEIMFRNLKQSEEALRKSEQTFSSFMHYLPAAAYMKDQDGRRLYCNDYLTSLFQIRPEEWLGKTDYEIFPQHVADNLRQHDLRVLIQGETLEEIEAIPTPMGTRTYLSYKFPVTIPDSPPILAGVSIDITEQEQSERELRRLADDLARSNKDLEQFAYIASHDLQEPLRVIRGYLQLIERRYKDQLDDDGREFIQFAVDGGQRMQTLIASLLTYARVGTKAVAFQTVDTADVFGDVQHNLKAAIEEAGAAITSDPLPLVYADPSQLGQLFQNLVGNALKFRRPDAPSAIHIGAKRCEGDWLFSVTDNGIGIEERHHEKIFMLFNRLHSKDAYSGEGIGLAVCKKIVEHHGGRIWVKSKLGEGTSFYFTLPDGNNP